MLGLILIEGLCEGAGDTVGPFEVEGWYEGAQIDALPPDFPPAFPVALPSSLLFALQGEDLFVQYFDSSSIRTYGSSLRATCNTFVLSGRISWYKDLVRKRCPRVFSNAKRRASHGDFKKGERISSIQTEFTIIFIIVRVVSFFLFWIGE
jgi:hypothetical protein